MAATRTRATSTGPIAALRREVADDATLVLSTDVFDTVLLRDSSTETRRFATAASRAAATLSVDSDALIRMRWMSHQNGYRSVAMERPDGEARFVAMCRAAVLPFGLDDSAATVLHDAELAHDAEHLRPNRPLLDYLAEVRTSGLRVIAVSDIYYSGADVEWLLHAIAGTNPFDVVYTSADLGATKMAGHLFHEVAHIEGLSGDRFVHIGDSHGSDVVNAVAAGWRAVHAPRGRLEELARVAGRAATLRMRMRRDR